MLYHIVEITLCAILLMCAVFGTCAHWHSLSPGGRIVAATLVILVAAMLAITVSEARNEQEGGDL